ncbi:MAG: GNAT family N-acetyltransferase [Rhizobiaceae bacterium]|nr:GNAT family N-acetyltransferase [Rhizobiaceae bacterium]
MTIRILKPGDEDAAEKFLSQYASSSMFLRSNLRAAGFEMSGKALQGIYYASFSQHGNIHGILAHYWNGNVMVQSEDNDTARALARSFRQTASQPVAGILGPANLVEVVIWELELENVEYSVNSNEELFALDLAKIIFPTASPANQFQMVEAVQIPKGILSEWLKSYDMEALGSLDNDKLAKQVENRANAMISENRGWVLLADNEPVCLCGLNARLPDIVQVGPVWTPRVHRNLGYARILVAMVLQHVQKNGVEKSILFTDNPAAAKAYGAIGFEKTGYYRMTLLKTPVEIR